MQALDFPTILAWLEKKADKYISGDVQKEILQIMALHILRSISSKIVSSTFFAVTADECTNIAKQGAVCSVQRQVDEALTDNGNANAKSGSDEGLWAKTSAVYIIYQHLCRLHKKRIIVGTLASTI